MTDVTALASFRSRYGQIRKGQQFSAEPGYAKQLERNKLVKIKAEGEQPGPSKNRNIPEAPARGGKDEQGQGGPIEPKSDPQQKTGGQGITSASLQAGRVSAKKTSRKSAAGGRRGTPTPRKGKTAKTPSTQADDAGA